MDKHLHTHATTDPVTRKPRPSEPLPPHPAFTTVVKLRHSHRPLWIVVVIILLGGISGTYYWQHQKVTSLTAQKLVAARTVTALDNQVATLQRTTTADTTTKDLLKIPELGIELSLPSSLSDMTYAVVYHSTAATNIGLSTLGLLTLDQNCSAAKGSLGWLSKTTGNYPTNPADLYTAGQLVKQYSNYYISYTASEAACSSNKAAQSLQATDTVALPKWSAAIQLLQ